jgi:hypothetical protein
MTSFTIGTIANPACHRGFADAGLRPCLKAYRTEKMRTIAKKNIKLAAKHKYTYQIVPAVAVLEDIMEVNRSLSQRGERAMDALYANRRQFEAIWSGPNWPTWSNRPTGGSWPMPWCRT